MAEHRVLPEFRETTEITKVKSIVSADAQTLDTAKEKQASLSNN